MSINGLIQPPDWVYDTVFYQIFPERFCNGDPDNDPPEAKSWRGRPERDSFFGGDLPGIEQRLDYLSNLGVNALYLTPVFVSPSNHKYDTADYYTVDPHFGGNEALRRLVTALHDRGMRIILDGVFNHAGDHFGPFRDLMERGEDSPYRNWFLPREFPLRQTPEPNYRVCGGAYNLPKFNDESAEVRQYLYGVATHWLHEAAIDGWRLDVPWETSHDFWRGFRQAVKAERADAYLVGELWGDPRPWLQGDQFDGAMNYPLREIMLRFFVQQVIDAGTFRRELDLLAEACGGALGAMLNLLGSHDTARILTVAEGNADVVAEMYTFLFAYPGCPMIYYGDEIGLTGGNDPECRGAMDWEEHHWNHALHGRIHRLTWLRREYRALRRGGYRVLYARDRVFCFMRQYEEEEIVAVFNAGGQGDKVELPLICASTRWLDLLSAEIFGVADGILKVAMPAHGARLLVPMDGSAAGRSLRRLHAYPPGVKLVERA